MSRVVLSRYESGAERIVVGVDRPLSTYFWQEMGDNNFKGVQIRGEGYMVNRFATMEQFWGALPPDVQDLVTYEVQDVLRRHSSDPNVGSIVVDMTSKRPGIPVVNDPSNQKGEAS